MRKSGGLTTVAAVGSTVVAGLFALGNGSIAPSAPAAAIPLDPVTAPLSVHLPAFVSPTSVVVAPGGTARLSGVCQMVGDAPAGPVVIRQVGAAPELVTTGIVAEQWSYDWTAPTDVSSLQLQVFCGDADVDVASYPASLAITVTFVAVEEPPSTTVPLSTTTTSPTTPSTTPTTSVASLPVVEIPETR
jgi:hypothetical protein